MLQQTPASSAFFQIIIYNDDTTKLMRGSARDLFVIPLIAFIIIAGSAMALYVMKSLTDDVETKLLALDNSPTSDIQTVFSGVNTAYTTVSNTVLFVVFSLMAASTITSLLVPNSPWFIFFAFLFLIVGIITTTVYKTTYDAMISEEPDLAGQVANTNWFWQNSIKIITLWGGINIFAMFYAATRGVPN